MALSLSSGSKSPWASSMPTCAQWRGRVGVVTRQHEGLDAQCVQFGDGFAAAVLDRVRHGEQAMHALLRRPAG
jgi:hypothetical protein